MSAAGHEILNIVRTYEVRCKSYMRQTSHRGEQAKGSNCFIRKTRHIFRPPLPKDRPRPPLRPLRREQPAAEKTIDSNPRKAPVGWRKRKRLQPLPSKTRRSNSEKQGNSIGACEGHYQTRGAPPSLGAKQSRHMSSGNRCMPLSPPSLHRHQPCRKTILHPTAGTKYGARPELTT